MDAGVGKVVRNLLIYNKVMSIQEKLRIFAKQKRRRVALVISDDDESDSLESISVAPMPSAAGGGLIELEKSDSGSDEYSLLPRRLREAWRASRARFREAGMESSSDSESSTGQPRITYPELEIDTSDWNRLNITFLGMADLPEEVNDKIENFVSDKMVVRDSIPYESTVAFTNKLINYTQKLFITQLPVDEDGYRSYTPLLDAMRLSTTLRVLKLSILSAYQGMYSIGHEDAGRFSDALAANTSLRVLDLSRQLEPLGIRSLSTSLQTNTTLCFLDLSGCRLIAGAAERLATALTVNTSLEKLVLHYCTFTMGGVKALGQALSRAKLKRLTMSDPILQDAEVDRLQVNECFGYVLRGLAFNRRLERLDLASLKVDEGILGALLEGIGNNKRLEFLDLRNNVLRSKRFYDELTEMLKMHVQLVVDVTGNRIEAEALEVVQNSRRESRRHPIILRHNLA